MKFLIPGFNDIIDIVITAFLIYNAILLLRNSGNLKIVYAAVSLFLMYFLSQLFHFRILAAFFSAVKSYWVLALIIIFQPEIRDLFNKISLNSEKVFHGRRHSQKEFFGALIDAVSAMSFRRIGALIVLERKQKLNELIEAGEYIDSVVSLRLILSIFNPKSVLHDGAIIIRNNRIMAAKVILPLSKNADYVQKFGTRHLAAIGISEISDALTIVVSEQTGKVSITEHGKIQTDLAFEELMQIITDATK